MPENRRVVIDVSNVDLNGENAPPGVLLALAVHRHHMQCHILDQLPVERPIRVQKQEHVRRVCNDLQIKKIRAFGPRLRRVHTHFGDSQELVQIESIDFSYLHRVGQAAPVGAIAVGGHLANWQADRRELLGHVQNEQLLLELGLELVGVLDDQVELELVARGAWRLGGADFEWYGAELFVGVAAVGVANVEVAEVFQVD